MAIHVFACSHLAHVLVVLVGMQFRFTHGVSRSYMTMCKTCMFVRRSWRALRGMMTNVVFLVVATSRMRVHMVHETCCNKEMPGANLVMAALVHTLLQRHATPCLMASCGVFHHTTHATRHGARHDHAECRHGQLGHASAGRSACKGAPSLS